MKKALYILSFLLISVPVFFFLGPRPQFDTVDPKITAINIPLDSLEGYLTWKESQVENLKPNNQSQVIWLDSVRKTDYAMVYLHGFSAGIQESDPVHRILAKKYGMNLYLHRIIGHGIDDPESFRDLTPGEMINSAKEAIAIAQIIGKKIIVISCSTGGTVSIYLTAHNPSLIHAQIMYSPNITLYDPKGPLVTGPWGRQIIKQVIGDYRDHDSSYYGTEIEQFWTLRYRSEGIIALQALLDQTMTEDVFQKINSPYFMGYYYKTDKVSDHVVSTHAMLEFDKKTSTKSNQKKAVAFPNVGNHVIASDLRSEDIESVVIETSAFIENVLGIQPIYSELNPNLPGNN